MTYSTPPTKILGDPAPASDWNTYHRDNFTHFADDHDHGSADHGATDLGDSGGLASAKFTDATAPAAPGAGKTLIYSTSGKGGQRAGAAGSAETFSVVGHTHTVEEKSEQSDKVAEHGGTSSGYGSLSAAEATSRSSYVEDVTLTFTPIGGSTVVVVASVYHMATFAVTGTVSCTAYIRILVDASQKVENSYGRTWTGTGGGSGMVAEAYWVEEDAAASSTVFSMEDKMTGLTGNEGSTHNAPFIDCVEVGVS